MIPIVAARPEKQKLFDVAQANYIKAREVVGDKYPNPSLVRFKIAPKYLGDVKPAVTYNRGMFDFVETKESPVCRTAWVSFANKYLGGGFLRDGYVQEEILTVEFYEMAQLIVGSGKPLMAMNEAFVFKNLIRSSISDPKFYGKMTQARLDYAENNAVANFLAIDAPRRRNRSDPYTIEELKHLTTKSHVGFSACVSIGIDIINTGNWGAGVFYNRRDVVYYIQLLSAWVSGVKKISFWMHTDNDVQHIMRAYANAKTVQDFMDAGPNLLDLQVSFSDLYK